MAGKKSSAEKRYAQSEVRRLHNKAIKSEVRTYAPLRSMFTSTVTESESGDALNAAGINALIRSAIMSEDHEHPLSDQKITALLQEKGINISRRAVAQLREKLGFRSSYERKFAPRPE